MEVIGVRHNTRTTLPGQQFGLSEAIQRSREILSAEPFVGNVQKAALAHILGGEHGRE
jgi:hypothetical protein